VKHASQECCKTLVKQSCPKTAVPALHQATDRLNTWKLPAVVEQPLIHCTAARADGQGSDSLSYPTAAVQGTLRSRHAASKSSQKQLLSHQYLAGSVLRGWHL
jgi:predicted nucleic acid-binding Zn ribbon protein